MHLVKRRLPEMASLCCGVAALAGWFTSGNWMVSIAACSIGALILVCS
jgi:hypothetical protein